MFPTFPPRYFNRRSPTHPTGNELRRQLGRLLGGDTVATTGPTNGRTVLVYREKVLVRKFTGLAGLDKQALQQALDIVLSELQSRK